MDSDFNEERETTMDIKWDGLKSYHKNECGMCGKGDHLRQCSAGGCYVHTKDTQIDLPDAEHYMYPLDRYLGKKPGLTEPEEWRSEAPPPSPSDDSDFFERAQSLVREAETQLDSFRKIYNIESESDKQQPKVTLGTVSAAECGPQVSHPSRMHNIVVALDALQAESSRLEHDVLQARAFARDISNELESDHKPSKSGRTCQRRPCERRTRKLVSERSHDPPESVKDTAKIPSRRKQAEYPRSEATSVNSDDIEQRKLSPSIRRQSQRSTWHTTLLRAKSSTEGTEDGYNTSDGGRYRESQSSSERRCKCALNKKKCLCLLYHRKVPEKPAVEGSCVCRGRKCSCSNKEIKKSSQKWQLSRHQSNVNICPCCEEKKRDHVTSVVKKKYTPGCCKATLIDVKTEHWSTEEEEEVARKKLPLAKLTIQELPSINIRRELKIQKVPSIDLPKPPGEEIPFTPRENVGLIDYTHDDRIRERQSRWRKGDDIRPVRQTSYTGENISESEMHRAHHVEKEVVVVHPSKPCTHKASRSSPCQCNLRSRKSVHFSGVEEHTFMFDLNHGTSFSLERHSSETEFSGIEMMGLRDSNFDGTDYDSEPGDICVCCRSLSCSSRHRATGTSKEQLREKPEPGDTRPIPKPKKQIPIPPGKKQSLGSVRPCEKSDNWPCKSRKTLEQTRTADMSSALQYKEDSIQTGVPLVRDRQEETVALSRKPQRSSSTLQKRDQASAEPQSPPPENRKHLVRSTITQTSFTPQEGRQWEQSSGAGTQLPPCKSRKNLVQARPSGTSFTPEERPSKLHHTERDLGGDQTGTGPRSPPCKHRRNLVQAVITQTSYTPQEGPSAFQSLGGDQASAEPQSPPYRHTKNLAQKQEPTTIAVPKTKIARHERKTYPFPDSSYIPIAAMAPFPSPAKDKKSKHSELRKTVPRSEKAHEKHRTAKMDQNSVFPDVSYIPMVIQSPKGIQSFYDTDFHDEAARSVPGTSSRREVPSKYSPSDMPTITTYSSKQQETRAATAKKENKEETRETKPKPPADGCSCGRAGGRCTCASQQKESIVKESEGKHSEHVNFDLKAKPNLNSVQISKRGPFWRIYDPVLVEVSSEDAQRTSSNNETDADVPVESQPSIGFIPHDHLSAENAEPESLMVGSSITVSDFLSSGSIIQPLFTSHETEQESTLCVNGIFSDSDRLHQGTERLSHTSPLPSEEEVAQQPEEQHTTSREVNVHGPGRSRGGITPIPPDLPESLVGQSGSGDVTSSVAIRELQQAIITRVEHAIMRGLLNESDESDSPSEVAPSELNVASPEAEEVAALPVEYEEDFESEEEGAEEEPASEEVVDSEDKAQSTADDQEFSLPSSQEAAAQTSFIKLSQPSQTFAEAAVQTSSSSADVPEVAGPTSPSTMKISPPPPPRSPFEEPLGASGRTSQRPCLTLSAQIACCVRKPSSSLASKDTSTQKSAVKTPPRTPVPSPKKGSPSRSPVKTPPPSPGSGSLSPVAAAKKTPLLSPDLSSSDTEEQVMCVKTPAITPPRSPSPSFPDVETPSPTGNQQQSTDSSQADEPVRPARERRQRRVEEEILVPIGSERTDVSSVILSDSVATDRTSETPVSMDCEETVLSEGEIRGDPCPCKNCRTPCTCAGVSTGEVSQPCRCGRSVGEVQPQMDDSIGEVRHRKHAGHRRQPSGATPRPSHRSSTYSDGQVLSVRARHHPEQSYSLGEVAYDTSSAGQLVAHHEQSPSAGRHIEVYLSSSLTGQTSDSELSSCASLCGEVFDQEIHLPSMSNGSDEPLQSIHSIGQLSEGDSGS